MIFNLNQLLFVAQICLVEYQHICIFNLLNHEFRPVTIFTGDIFKIFKEFSSRYYSRTVVDVCLDISIEMKKKEREELKKKEKVSTAVLYVVYIYVKYRSSHISSHISSQYNIPRR